LETASRREESACRPLILDSELPAIDIEIEKNTVRERCLELYPNREELYEMVYESRFQRLWDQFRDTGKNA
jgi:hypothetical protein